MEDIKNEIEKSYLAQVLNSAAITGHTEEVEKAFSNIIEKGKKANIGEIREWAGGKFRKTQSGWEPVKNSGSVKEVISQESDKTFDDFKFNTEYEFNVGGKSLKLKVGNKNKTTGFIGMTFPSGEVFNYTLKELSSKNLRAPSKEERSKQEERTSKLVNQTHYMD